MFERALREWVFRSGREGVAALRGDALVLVETVPELQFGVADIGLVRLALVARLFKCSGLTETLARRMPVNHRHGCQDDPIPPPPFYPWCLGAWHLSKFGTLRATAKVPARVGPLSMNRLLYTTGRFEPRAWRFWKPPTVTDRRLDCRTERADAFAGIDRILCSLASKQGSG